MKLNRIVTKEECSWLDEDLPKGTELREYTGYTYGCVTPEGIACVKEYGDTPFFEVPREALQA